MIAHVVGNHTINQSRQQWPIGPYWRTYDMKCLPNRVVWLVWKSTCHNKTRTLQYNICLNFLIAWESQKSTERSVYHNVCVPYKQPLTLLILLCYFLLVNGILCCEVGIKFKTTLIIFNGFLIMNNFNFN